VSRVKGVTSTYVRDAAQQVIAANHVGPSGPIEQEAYSYGSQQGGREAN
jgi:hypothetical protein